MTLKVLDMFSGIGGFSLGLERAGMKTVRFIEKDPFCRRVLAKHWPDVPCDDDVTTAQFTEGEADVICGGFPCQDISIAGKRTGVTGLRSGLYREMVRAIRLVRPLHAIMENVAELLRNGMGTVLGGMAENGYDAEWDCISASSVGAPHGRDRVWITFTDADKLKRKIGCHESFGRWERSAGEAEEAGHADCVRKLQPPRVLGDIRGRIDHAACCGTWWASDWKTQFEAFRGMDDGAAGRLDRSINRNGVSACGNSLIPQIPEMIGKAIMEQVADE